MEKSSCDTADHNNMYHNAFENMKMKIRGVEKREVKESLSCFSQLCPITSEKKEKRRNMTKEVVDIRQYVTNVAIREHIMAYVMMLYLSDKELARVVCTSKAAFDCNVSVEEASLNLDLL